MAKIINKVAQGYQIIPRELVLDSTISDRARFVYCFMASKPEDWEFFLEPMAKEIGYSIDTLRKYIKELVESGWLVKGEQDNENGRFGSVYYELRTTKFSDTEIFRHGKNTTQHIIDNKEIRDIHSTNVINKEKEIDKSISEKDKKDDFFEECWKKYERKGSKKAAKAQWAKLNDGDKQNVKKHIPHYVESRELTFRKDFVRYLSDRVFETPVYNKNHIVYDPDRDSLSEYIPTGSSMTWNDHLKTYVYVGGDMRFDVIDGYTNDNRPDGARMFCQGWYYTWSKEQKKWING